VDDQARRNRLLVRQLSRLHLTPFGCLLLSVVTCRPTFSGKSFSVMLFDLWFVQGRVGVLAGPSANRQSRASVSGCGGSAMVRLRFAIASLVYVFVMVLLTFLMCRCAG